MILQKTIKNAIHMEGIGLHSGHNVRMKALPAPVDTGIVFKRVDASPPLLIPIAVDRIEESLLCTRLASPIPDQDFSISTIEHLLSAIAALEIDNLLIELDAGEIPIMDGSAAPYIFWLQSAGICELEEKRKFLKIKKTIRLEDQDKFVELTPISKGFELSVSIDFAHPVIQKTPQQVEFTFHPMIYMKEISRARTFGFVKDLEKLQANGLAKGASLENAVGIGDEAVLNPDGLRYEDEFVKHKLLDAIGDLYVAGPMIGKFTAHKSSHSLNNRLLRKLFSNESNYEWISL